jgi:hypothetical protein
VGFCSWFKYTGLEGTMGMAFWILAIYKAMGANRIFALLPE